MVDRPTRFQRGPAADPEKTKRDARDLEESFAGSLTDHEARIEALEDQVESLLGIGTPILVDEGLVSDAVTAGIIS